MKYFWKQEMGNNTGKNSEVMHGGPERERGRLNMTERLNFKKSTFITGRTEFKSTSCWGEKPVNNRISPLR
jgi:hypothetical protein